MFNRFRFGGNGPQDQEMKQPLLDGSNNPAIAALKEVVEYFKDNPHRDISSEVAKAEVAVLFTRFGEALPSLQLPSQQNEVEAFLRKHLYELPPLEEAQPHISQLNLRVAPVSPALQEMNVDNNDSVAPQLPVPAARNAPLNHYQNLAAALAVPAPAPSPSCLTTAFQSCVQRCNCGPCKICCGACSSCCACASQREAPAPMAISTIREQAGWAAQKGLEYLNPSNWCCFENLFSCQCCGNLKHRICNIPNPLSASVGGPVAGGGLGAGGYYALTQYAAGQIDTANTALNTFAAKPDVVQMLIVLRDYGYEFLSPAQQALYAIYQSLTSQVSSATSFVASLKVGGAGMISFTTLAGILLCCGLICCYIHYKGNRITNFSLVWNVCYQMFQAARSQPAAAAAPE